MIGKCQARQIHSGTDVERQALASGLSTQLQSQCVVQMKGLPQCWKTDRAAPGLDHERAGVVQVAVVEGHMQQLVVKCLPAHHLRRLLHLPASNSRDKGFQSPFESALSSTHARACCATPVLASDISLACFMSYA